MPWTGTTQAVINATHANDDEIASALKQTLPGIVSSITLRDGTFTPAGAAAIGAAAAASCKLTRLDLSGSALRDQGAVAFAASYVSTLHAQNNSEAQLPLRELDLSATSITAMGFERLLSAVAMTAHSLSTLRASKNRLGRDAAVAAVRVVRRCGVESLELSDNDLGECGAAALGGVFRAEARSPRAGGASSGGWLSPAVPLRLRRLDLTGNAIGDAGAEALCRGIAGQLWAGGSGSGGKKNRKPENRPSTSGDISANDVGEDGSLAAPCPLQELLLGRNGITGAGAAHLCGLLNSGYNGSSGSNGDNGFAVRLTVLDLSGNRLAAADVAAAVEAAADSRYLRVLRLGGAEADAAAVAAAAELLTVNGELRVLDISPREEFARRLLGVPRELSALRRALAAAAAAIAGNTTLCELELGLLARTPGADDAAQALASATATNARLADAAGAAAEEADNGGGGGGGTGSGGKTATGTTAANAERGGGRGVATELPRGRPAEAGRGRSRKGNSGIAAEDSAAADTAAAAGRLLELAEYGGGDGGGGGDGQDEDVSPSPIRALSELRSLRREYTGSLAALSGELRALLPKLKNAGDVGDVAAHSGNGFNGGPGGEGEERSPRLDAAALAALQEQVLGLQRRLGAPLPRQGLEEDSFGLAAGAAEDRARFATGAATASDNGNGNGGGGNGRDDDFSWSGDEASAAGTGQAALAGAGGHRRQQPARKSHRSVTPPRRQATGRLYEKDEVAAVAEAAAARAVAAARRQWEAERTWAWENIAARATAAATAAAAAEVARAEQRLQAALAAALQEVRWAEAEAVRARVEGEARIREAVEALTERVEHSAPAATVAAAAAAAAAVMAAAPPPAAAAAATVSGTAAEGAAAEQGAQLAAAAAAEARLQALEEALGIVTLRSSKGEEEDVEIGGERPNNAIAFAASSRGALVASLHERLRDELSAELNRAVSEAEVTRRIDYTRLEGVCRGLSERAAVLERSVAREQQASLKLLETIIGAAASDAAGGGGGNSGGQDSPLQYGSSGRHVAQGQRQGPGSGEAGGGTAAANGHSMMAARVRRGSEGNGVAGGARRAAAWAAEAPPGRRGSTRMRM